MSKNGADFHLPDEILSVIPTDPFDQLDLARKITSMAIASRVSQLEAENESLRQKITNKDQRITELQDRLSELHRLFHDSDSRLRLVLEENLGLVKERDTLALTAKKLSRDLMKLEAFKRQLMLSLNDDSPSQEGDQPSLSSTSSNIWSSKTVEARQDEAKNVGDKLSITPYITPNLTPHAGPRVLSTSGSPTKSCFDDQSSKSSWYPSSQQTSAASSPPCGQSLQGRTPQIDGKEFFRLARTRLSYEQFGSFLANIKELNAQRKSRQETLAKADQIFGIENKDLYLYFERLLNRNLR